MFHSSRCPLTCRRGQCTRTLGAGSVFESLVSGVPAHSRCAPTALADDPQKNAVVSGVKSIDVQRPVQVVELMLKNAGTPSVGSNLDGVFVDVDASHDNVLRPPQRETLARKGQAAFGLLVLVGDASGRRRHVQNRIDHDATPRGTVVVRVAIHKQALPDPDLRCGQADSRGGIHRFEHVVHESAQRIVEIHHRSGRLVQDRCAVDLDREYRHEMSLSSERPLYSLRVMFPIDDLSGITEQFTQDPVRLIGIPFALVGAVLMSLGAQFQHRGVVKVERISGRDAASGLNFAQIKALLQRPSWVIGTVMLALAIVFQLSALAFSPLILVQPLGAIALVITSVLNARIAGITLNRRSVVAIVACVAGIALFVTTAAIVGIDRPVTTAALLTILVAMGVVLLVYAMIFMLTRSRARAIFYIIAAGTIYGFVATLAKVVISRISHGTFGWLTILCVIGVVLGTALGAYFVQNAYASGPPDLVIAGLTVIDPLVAVAIGIIVLHEALGAPLWAVFAFVIAGGAAIWGVFQLARHHPQAKQ